MHHTHCCGPWGGPDADPALGLLCGCPIEKPASCRTAATLVQMPLASCPLELCTPYPLHCGTECPLLTAPDCKMLGLIQWAGGGDTLSHGKKCILYEIISQSLLSATSCTVYYKQGIIPRLTRYKSLGLLLFSAGLVTLICCQPPASFRSTYSMGKREDGLARCIQQTEKLALRQHPHCLSFVHGELPVLLWLSPLYCLS